jgi:hypothetical protein
MLLLCEQITKRVFPQKLTVPTVLSVHGGISPNVRALAELEADIKRALMNLQNSLAV